jgi:hypothetical protein
MSILQNLRKTSALYGQRYVDVPMTGVAVRRMQSDARFIATTMVPRLPVLKPSGTYPVFSIADINRDEMQVRGPESRPAKAGWRHSYQTYSTDARSLAYDLNDAEAAASDVEIDPSEMIPSLLAYKALLHLERRMAAKLFVAGNWYRVVTGASSDTTGSATAKNRLYVDNASADPIEAFTDEIRILSLLTGADPSQMGIAFGNRLAHKLRNSAKVKSQIVGLAGGAIGNAIVGMARQASMDEIARLLGIAWCGASSAVYNSAAKTSDQSVYTNTPIVPADDALLFVNPSIGQTDAVAAMTRSTPQPPAFCRPVWTAAVADGVSVRRVRDELAGPLGSWTHVVDVFQGFEIVTPTCGTYFSGLVTP